MSSEEKRMTNSEVVYGVIGIAVAVAIITVITVGVCKVFDSYHDDKATYARKQAAIAAVCEKYDHTWGKWKYLTGCSVLPIGRGTIQYAWKQECHVCGKSRGKRSYSKRSPGVTLPMRVAAEDVCNEREASEKARLEKPELDWASLTNLVVNAHTNSMTVYGPAAEQHINKKWWEFWK